MSDAIDITQSKEYQIGLHDGYKQGYNDAYEKFSKMLINIEVLKSIQISMEKELDSINGEKIERTINFLMTGAPQVKLKE